MSVIDARFGAYVAVMAVLIVTPGPDMALVTRTALTSGRRAASFTAFGVGVGILAWAAAVALGVGGLMERSAVAFTTLKIAGAGYLFYLGARSLLSGSHDASDGPAGLERARLGGLAAFRQGALGNVLNPKAGVIFVTVLPQFLRSGDGFLRLSLMLLVFELLIVGWLNLYGALVSAAGQSRFGGRVRQTAERAAGVVLIALGLRLAVERR